MRKVNGNRVNGAPRPYSFREHGPLQQYVRIHTRQYESPLFEGFSDFQMLQRRGFFDRFISYLTIYEDGKPLKGMVYFVGKNKLEKPSSNEQEPNKIVHAREELEGKVFAVYALKKPIEGRR